MADNLDLASNQLQSMRNVLRQFKTAANAANPQPEKLEKLKKQYNTIEQKVSNLVDNGSGRDWEPLKREAKQMRDEFSRLDRAVATKQSAAAAEAQSRDAADGSSGPGAGAAAGGSLGLGHAVVVNTAPLDTEEALQRERLQGVVEIEGQMGELKSMYQDFNHMVNDQQQGLDNVEGNVDKSTKHVERGVQELKGASSVQKSSRKWMCILLVILAVGAVIGVIVFLAK